VDFLRRFVFVANEGTDSVSTYSIGGSGILTPVADSPFPAGHVPASIAVDLSGQFLYVANVNSGDVSAYRIRENGGLTPVVGSPFSAEEDPASVAVAP
jgi:6-phosphogluconolactonase